MSALKIRPLNEGDREWVRKLLEEQWGSVRMVSRGGMHYLDTLPGFAAIMDDKPVGLATYRIEGDQCEITSLNSLVEGKGLGSALIEACKNVASSAGCRRLWLITTNDNMHALRFYQKRGFTLAAIYPNSLEEARRLKPEIPLTGMDGIPLRDEIEMDIFL